MKATVRKEKIIIPTYKVGAPEKPLCLSKSVLIKAVRARSILSLLPKKYMTKRRMWNTQPLFSKMTIFML